MKTTMSSCYAPTRAEQAGRNQPHPLKPLALGDTDAILCVLEWVASPRCPWAWVSKWTECKAREAA